MREEKSWRKGDSRSPAAAEEIRTIPTIFAARSDGSAGGKMQKRKSRKNRSAYHPVLTGEEATGVLFVFLGKPRKRREEAKPPLIKCTSREKWKTYDPLFKGGNYPGFLYVNFEDLALFFLYHLKDEGKRKRMVDGLHKRQPVFLKVVEGRKKSLPCVRKGLVSTGIFHTLQGKDGQA